MRTALSRSKEESRTAVLAGATGLVGGALLTLLLAQRDYSRVTVLGRRPPSREGGKVKFVFTDYSSLDTLAAELAVDDVFCCLGTTIRKAGSEAAFERVDYHMVVDLARAANKAGAKNFLVVSAAGTSLKAPAFYPRTKARMEQAVSEIGFKATHILRPSLLLGTRQESRPAERLFQLLSPLYSPLMTGPLRKYRPVRAEDVAAAMVKLALGADSGVHIHYLPL
jgi:uncharacterized protein YbjT (DUF2867 family)